MARQVTKPTADKLPAKNDVKDLMRQHAGEGLDTIGVDDLLIPRLVILQGLSPQVAQGRPEFDPNARVGQIYDVGMRETFPDGIEVVVAHYTRVWNEWHPRGAAQRGIVRRHLTPAIMSNTRPGENNQPTLPNGNVITETMEFYVLNLTAQARKSFIPMSVTQLREGKRITTYIQSEEVDDGEGGTYKPPMYYRSFKLGTVPTSNAKGTWMLWKVERGTPLHEMPNGAKLFNEVRSFREAIVAGHARGDMSEEGQADLPWDQQGRRSNEGPL